MHSKTLLELKESFEGKVCTIFTKATCKTFTERIWREHYAIRVLKVTTDGIFGEHPYTHTKSFFYADHIIFLQEEVEIDPNNPIHKKMIEEYEEKTGKKIISDVSPHLAPTLENKPEEQTQEASPPVVVNDDNEEEASDESIFIDIEALDALTKYTKKQSENQVQGFNEFMPSKNNDRPDDLVQIQ